MAFSKKIIIIDSHALIHRSYHALPPLTTKKGQIVNAVYGFTSVLLKVVKELKPDYILAAFDLEAKTFRHRAYEQYKAQRKKADEELYAQIPIVKQVLDIFNIPYFEKQGFEADDVIGTIVDKTAKFFKKNEKPEMIIVTGDLDTLQLVNPITKIYTFKKRITDTVIYDKKAVFLRYQLAPDQMVDFKGLKGDPSDNIPGVPGIGEKTAIELVKTFGNMANLYKELEGLDSSLEKDKKSGVEIKGVKLGRKILENLLTYKDQAFFSKELATIRRDVPMEIDWEKLEYIKDFDRQKVTDLFKELEFYSLISRLDDLFKEKSILDKEPSAGAVKKNDRYEELTDQIDKLRNEGVLSQKVYDLENKLMPVIKSMEEIGIKIDKQHLENLSKKLSKEIEKLEKNIYEQTGEEFNINSSQQLSRILFEKLSISVKGLRKTPKGAVISTNARELVKLRKFHPVVELILKYRELSKLKTTYTDSLVKVVNPETGRIHTKFNPLGAVTGRISSSGPNLQNIPSRTPLGNEIRKAFVAESGWVLVSGDYSQIELRVIAALADDSKMKQAFLQGKDIHTITAAEINKISIEKVTPSMRSLAKAINFGIIYGIGVNGLAEGAGITRQEAKEFINKYHNDFPELTGYIDWLKQIAYEKGYAETFFGRRRFLPDLKSKLMPLRRAAERMAVNMPIQGTAADIVKIAMIAIHSQLSSGNVRLLLQVHDELVLEVKKEHREEVSQKVKTMMEQANPLPIPLKAEISIGDNWGEMKKIS